MQVKKYEAPTMQEALETIKRELGPEAIILQTKKNKRGFGLMSRESVEVTAAISERSLQKKTFAESHFPEDKRAEIGKMPAQRQAEFIEKASERKASPPAKTPKPAPTKAKPAPEVRTEVNARGEAVANSPNPLHRRPPGFRYIDVRDDDEGVPERQTGTGAIARGAGGIAGRTAGMSPGMSVEEELRLLKRMIEEMKSAQETVGPSAGAQALMGSGGTLSTPALQDAFEQLIMNGVDKRLAFRIARAAGFELGPEASKSPEQVLDQIAAEIMRETEVHSTMEALAQRREGEPPAVIALVGPTGVGKTTTVAKIASLALLERNLKVGLINLDSYKVAAFDQLATYAKILNVPFRSVATLEDLRVAMQDFQGLDLVLIDTTGRSQKDPSALQEMQKTLSVIPGIRSQLVLAVTTRDAEMFDMTHRFSIFKPEGLIISKLDEAMTHGAILNVSEKAKLPLLYFTTGQRVPEDIEESTKERVAALILDL